jgi:hypothetical protein
MKSVLNLLSSAEAFFRACHSFFKYGNLSLLWKHKLRYRAHKSPILITILSQMKAVRTLPFHFLEIHFNIILQAALVLIG